MKSVANTRTARFRRSIYRRLPEWMRRRDFELFTLLLCITGGVPLLLSPAVEASSMEAQVHPVVLITWAMVLVFTPPLVVFGAWKAHRKTGLEEFRWIRWEVLGLRLLSYAAHLYAVVITVNSLSKQGVFQPAVSIIVVFGLTCTSRAWGLLDDIERFWEQMGVEHGRE